MTPARGHQAEPTNLTTLWHQCAIEDADQWMAWHYTAIVWVLILTLALWVAFRRATRSKEL